MSRGCLAIMASSKARPQVGQDVVVGDTDNEFPPLFDSVAVVFDNIFGYVRMYFTSESHHVSVSPIRSSK